MLLELFIVVVKLDAVKYIVGEVKNDKI